MTCHHPRRRAAIYVYAILGAILLLLTAGVSDAFGAESAHPDWYDQKLADSLGRMAAGLTAAEPTVQQILDSLGTGLDATADVLMFETFGLDPGCGWIELIAEYSGTMNTNAVCWYRVGNKDSSVIIVPGPASAGDTSTFDIGNVDSIGLCLFRAPYTYWYSQKIFNLDAKSHVKFYPTPDPNAFYMFWEDLPFLTDADFNDLVAIFRLPSGLPEVVCRPPAVTSLCDSGTVCFYFTATDPDGDSLLVDINGPGVSESRLAASGVEDSVCIPVAAGGGDFTYDIRTTDNCGAIDSCEVSFTMSVNSPPTVSGPDSSVFLCEPDSIRIPLTVADPDGSAGLFVHVSNGEGRVDQSTWELVVPGSAEGIVTSVVRVVDPCGLFDRDTIYTTVSLNSPPSVDLNNGAPVFQCEPGEICVSYTVSDPDSPQPVTEDLLSGFGTIDTAANTVCFTPDTSGTYQIIVKVTDSCGAMDTDTVTVLAEANEPPSITLGNDTTINQCTAAMICLPYSVSDPNGLSGLVEAYISGPGAIDTAANQVCFTPSGDGVHTIIVEVLDPCGETDRDTIAVTVHVNTLPTLDLGPDFELTLCAPQTVCADYTITDPDGDNFDPMLCNGPDDAYFDLPNGRICFPSDTAGVYCLCGYVEDTCGVRDYDTIYITVRYNDPPVVSLGEDRAVAQCAPGEICIEYTVSDLDGSAIVGELLTLAPQGATIDTALDRVCFTPPTAGEYCIAVAATDSCGDTGEDTVCVTVNLNGPPTIDLGADQDIFVCGPQLICIPYGISDPDSGSGLSVVLVSGPGNVDSLNNRICFTPGAAGTSIIIAKVTDSCGAMDTDTVAVTVTFNSNPQIDLGADFTTFQCAPTPICIDYTVSDPDGPAKLTEQAPILPPGAQLDTALNKVCFTPDTAGVYKILMTVSDSCGGAAADTIYITVQLNRPPTLAFGADITRFQCSPTQICVNYTVSDPDGPAKLTEMLQFAPAGAVLDTVANSVCFTPTGSGQFCIGVKVTDSCGLTDADTICVDVTINAPPQLSVPDTVAALLCEADSICIGGIAATDENGNLKSVDITQGIGSIDQGTGILCFDADTMGVYCFEITALDSCNASDVDTTYVVVQLNQAPSVNITGIPDDLVFEAPTQICFSVDATDPDTDQLFEVTKVEGAGAFSAILGRNAAGAQHCFTADTTGCYRFIFDVADSCGLHDRDTALICVSIDTAFIVCIDTIQALNAELVSVRLRVIETLEMGGFDFLLCYDQTALGFAGITADSAIAEWEYFTFRTGAQTGCFICPSGSIRILGIADMNNGAAHPSEDAYKPKGPLALISFYTTPDRNFIGQCVPIRFCWMVCSDNAISNRDGDTTYLSFTGVADSCFDGDKFTAIRKILFCDGAICIIPPEDDRGDLNLNGIVYDIGDAVLFSNWFIYGNGVWNPLYMQNQILASDVNCDGIVLTLADLILLIRIIAGDASPVNCPDVQPKVVNSDGHAEIIVERGHDRLDVYVQNTVDLGGVFVSLSAEASFGGIEWAELPSGLSRSANVDGSVLRALIVRDTSGGSMPAGRHLLFGVALPANADLEAFEAQAGDPDGAIVTAEVTVAGAGSRPGSYQLQQNYPNPFNAGTTIRFHLPQTSDWRLTIYNVLGQPVRRFEGAAGLGWVSVNWLGDRADGHPVGTGIYFARLEASGFVASRKMLLLK